jgi:hypothetical protein
MISRIKNKLAPKYLIALLCVVFSFSSCEYETIEIDLPNLEEPVSFSADIVPIFTNVNNCTACHGAGATSPELSAAKAYASIVPNLINTSDAELSKIYQHPHPSSTTHGFKKYTHAQAALVLAWITQGAENN